MPPYGALVSTTGAEQKRGNEQNPHILCKAYGTSVVVIYSLTSTIIGEKQIAVDGNHRWRKI
eukprot:COSAG02_NODE_1558_length_11928_cov_4.044974_8_plen_62_part_00